MFAGSSKPCRPAISGGPRLHPRKTVVTMDQTSVAQTRLQEPCASFLEVLLLLLGKFPAERFGLCKAALQLLKLLRQDLTRLRQTQPGRSQQHLNLTTAGACGRTCFGAVAASHRQTRQAALELKSTEQLWACMYASLQGIHLSRSGKRSDSLLKGRRNL